MFVQSTARRFSISALLIAIALVASLAMSAIRPAMAETAGQASTRIRSWGGPPTAASFTATVKSSIRMAEFITRATMAARRAPMMAKVRIATRMRGFIMATAVTLTAATNTIAMTKVRAMTTTAIKATNVSPY
jgi:hypothetical protein